MRIGFRAVQLKLESRRGSGGRNVLKSILFFCGKSSDLKTDYAPVIRDYPPVAGVIIVTLSPSESLVLSRFRPARELPLTRSVSGGFTPFSMA